RRGDGQAGGDLIAVDRDQRGLCHRVVIGVGQQLEQLAGVDAAGRLDAAQLPVAMGLAGVIGADLRLGIRGGGGSGGRVRGRCVRGRRIGSRGLGGGGVGDRGLGRGLGGGLTGGGLAGRGGIGGGGLGRRR